MQRIFGSKREDITGSWRKFHKELYNLHSSPKYQVHEIKDKMGRVCSMDAKTRNGPKT
jgi:hypothetical protein